jgi:hypothetical protein
MFHQHPKGAPMTSDDLKIALQFLSRVQVRGFEEEEQLLKVIRKMQSQIACSNKSKNEYTKDGTKAA